MTKVDENVFYELVVEGSTRTLVYQPADLAAHLFIQTGKRYLGFTPTEQYSAKSAYGIKGLIEVPELKEGDPNNFLTTLFDKVRSNLAKEAAALDSEKETYGRAMADASDIVNAVQNPEDVLPASEKIKALKHGLTSQAEGLAMLKDKIDKLGIVWDKASKSYVRKS